MTSVQSKTEDAPPCRPPRILNVVRDEQVSEEVDWTGWYLTDEDDMGQSPEQAGAIRGGYGGVATRVDELGWSDALVGTDAFFGWVTAHPLVRISPDVYVLRSPPEPLPKSFQTWLPGHSAPVIAFEIVSQDWRKDYEEIPEKYAALGTNELVVFDPEAARGVTSIRSQRVALQVFRRTADGLFLRVEAGAGPVRCGTLRCYVVAADVRTGACFRLTYDAAGQELIPDAAELAERRARVAEEQRDAAEERRAAAEEQRAAAEGQRDAEQAARLKAEARLRELEARLAASED